MLKIKNTLKKLSILMCTMLVTITNLSFPVHAEMVTVTKEEDYSDTVHAYIVSGDLHSDLGGNMVEWRIPGYLALWAAGQNVFCIEPWKSIDLNTAVSETDLRAVLDSNPVLRKRLSQIGYYGFWSSGRSRADYITTQLMIWEARGWTVTTKPSYYDEKKAAIEEKIARSAKQLSFSGQTKTAKVKETVSFTDTNGVLGDYMRSAGYPNQDVSYKKDGVNFYWHGNTIYLQPTADAGDKFTFTSYNIDKSYVGTPIVYYNGNSQKTSPLNRTDDPAWSTFTLNVQKFGNLKITKLNEKGETVPNTSFKLSYNADMSSPIGTYTTGDDGTVTIQELEPKTVYIQEISVPKPLELDSTIHSITVRPNETVSYTQRNKYERGDLKLAKVDEDGKAVPNTTFKVSYNADMSDPIGTYKTGSDGTVTVQKLIAKTVYIQETNVPVELIVDSTIHSKLVEYNKTVTYTARNLYKKGDVEIKKLDKKSGKVVKKAGVEFDIFKTDGTKVATVATNSNGVALYKNLRYGDYFFSEKTQPDKYYISNERINFQIRKDKEVIEKTLSNDPIKGKINLTKEDCEVGKRAQGDGTLQGAVYTLYAQENILDPADDSVIYSAGTEIKKATIKDYKASFDDLYLGKYRIEETKPPKEGYLLDEKEYIVNLTSAEHVKTVTSCDPVMKQPFKIAKFASDGDSGVTPAIIGAKFTYMLQKYIDKYKTIDAAVAAAESGESEILPSEWGVLTIDEEGTAISDPLPFGEYMVYETYVPEGVEGSQPFPVSIKENSKIPQKWIYVNDKPFKPVLAIVKKDAETKRTIPLPGVTFKIKCLSDNFDFKEGQYAGWWIKYPSWKFIDEFTTGEDGTVTLPEGLPVGHYQVVEIKTPDGYLLAKTGKVFEIKQNDLYQQTGPDDHTIVTTLLFEDTPVKGQVKVQKEAMLFKGYTSMETKYGELFTPIYERGLLSDVKFEIKAETDIIGADGTRWYRAGQRVEILTTDGETITQSSHLPLGTDGHNIYSIREIETAEGYVLDDTVHYFRFDYVDGDTAVVNPTWLDEDGKVIEKEDILALDNQHETGIALATKIMEQSDIKDKAEAYKNVVFGIFADQVDQLEKDSLVSIVDVEEEGTASAKLTQKGTYHLKELTTDPDYELSNEKYPFTYTYNGNQLQEIRINNNEPIYNLLKRGSIEVYKQDTDSKLPLMNVCFELATDKEFTNIIKTTWTDENGKAIFDELETNYTYFIREKYENENDMIHKGYVYDPTIHEVKLSDEIIKVNVTNTQVKGKVQFTKTGESFHSVEIIEGDFGKEYHPLWEQGNLLGAELTVKAAEDITTWDQREHYKKGDIVTVLESDWQTTDSLLLPVGKYEAYESKTPHGYIKDETIYEFEITPNGKAEIQLNEVTINNQRAKVNLDFTKELEKQKTFVNEKAYEDVVFGLYAREDIYNYMGKVVIENGSLIGISHIDENGHLINTFDLPNGVYCLKELQTNDQYNLDETEYDFEISYHGETIKEYTVEINHGKPINNELKRGSIEIIKTTKDDIFYSKAEQDYANSFHTMDEYARIYTNPLTKDEPNYLAGVTFELATDEAFTNIIETKKTDGNGRIVFDNLELGVYFAREKAALKHYVLTDEVFKVQLTKHGQMETIEVNNQLVKANIGIHKIDEINHTIALKGAEFTMYADQECTKVIAKAVTNQSGNAIFKDLSFGTTVYIKETKAPDGYELSDKVIEVTIDDEWMNKDMHQRVIEVTNHKIPDKQTPNTGDNTNIFMYLGLLGISLGAILLSMKKRYTNR